MAASGKGKGGAKGSAPPAKKKKKAAASSPTPFRVRRQEVTEILDRSMGVYSFNINLFRSFPDVRTGLKPVQLRILYASYLKKAFPTMKGFYKSASIVGDVLGKYHPHGDASVYDAMAKMAQDFYMNVPMMDKQGNMGTQFGDPPSAMRYTEAKLSRYGMELLEDIDKNAVEFAPNYDNREVEPLAVPCKYPNLLINGSYGIGQGYITSIPPHNFGEVVDAAVKIIRGEITTAEELAEILAPDYPTGGIIINRSELKKFYVEGSGEKQVVKVRARIETTKDGNLLITELPYMKYTAGETGVLNQIGDLVREGRIDGISDIIDESNEKNGVRVLIKIKRGHDPAVVESQLYKYTALQTSLLFNLICAEGNHFRSYNILELFQKWIDHRKTTLKRIFNFRISRIRRRMHIIEGLLKALANIDAVIKLFKTSKTQEEVREKLVEKFDLTRMQADYIGDMPLNRILAQNTQKLRDEHAELARELEDLTGYFEIPKGKGPTKLERYIIRELEEGKKRYGRPRRTELTDRADESEDATIPNTHHTVLLTNEGFVKKLDLKLDAQGAGGKGRSVGRLKEGDYVVSAFTANNRDSVLFFTNRGNVYPLKVHQLRDTKVENLGVLVGTYVPLKKDEKVVTALALSQHHFMSDEGFLTFVTERGMVKRTLVKHYASIQRTGVWAIRLNEGDRLVGVEYADEEHDIVIGTAKGLGIRFGSEDVSPTLRMTIGVKAMPLDEDDRVTSFTRVRRGDDRELLVVHSSGAAKRVGLDAFQSQDRNSRPKLVTKLRDGEELVRILMVRPDDEVTVVSSKKMLRTSVSGVARGIRQSTPKKSLITLEKGDRVLDVIVD